MKPIKMTTGRGIFMYPYLFSPDTKFNQDGIYTVNLQLQGDAAKTLKDELTNIRDKYKEQQVAITGKEPKSIMALPFKDDTTDAGEACISFKFKMKPFFRSKNGDQIDQRPTVFDAKLQPLDESCKMGNGSAGKVSFDCVPFNSNFGLGVTLRLRAVQVLELVAYNGGGGDSNNGFSIEEGFAAEVTKDASAATTSQAAPQESGNAADF